MTTKRLRCSLVLFAFAWLGADVAAAGLDPAVKCEALKLKHAGKYSLCRMKAEMKAVRKGLAPDFTKCESKFSDKWAKIESKGGCAIEGDLETERVEITADTVQAKWRISDGPRFIDHGDGTVTDRKTNLMWEKKVDLDGAADFFDPFFAHDADLLFAWSGTCELDPAKFCQFEAEAAAACGDGVGCELCGPGEGECEFDAGALPLWGWLVSLNQFERPGGHSDWRIPSPHELLTIVDYERLDPSIDPALHGSSCGGACTDLGDPDCACTVAEGYWSSASVAYDLDYAWTIEFSDCDLRNDLRSAAHPARAVRGGPFAD